MAKANQYAKKAQMQKALKFLNSELEAKEKIDLTLGLTAKDVVIGVVGGRLLAAGIKGWSIPLGAILIAGGYYSSNKLFSILGVGTMAANNYKKDDTVKGIDGLDGWKDRLKAAKDSLIEDFHLTKLFKKKETTAATTSGFGNVQYFSYPDEMNGDTDALDDIEKQIAQSAIEYQQRTGGGTIYNDSVGELEELEERLY